MSFRRYFSAVAAVYLIYEIISYAVNSLLLNECFTELSSVWRPDMKNKMYIMYGTDLLFTLFFTAIYTRWSRKFTVASGILYGLMVALMMNTTTLINQWVMFPLTDHMTLLWIFFGLLQFVLCGIVLGAIYRPEKKIIDNN